MKPPLSCFLALVLAAVGYGATQPPAERKPLTAKELAQGYREHVILARPHAARRHAVEQAEARERVRVRAKLEKLGDLRVIDLDESDSADTAIARLRASGEYEFVEPDYLRWPSTTTPNDPRFTDGSLWALNNYGQTGGNIIGIAGADIKATQAWDIIREAPNVIVAVVDTGINLNHQDLAGNLWTNPISGRSDVHGANFVGGRGTMVSGDPTDDDGHGTHVAGTIGAVGNNSFAAAGVAWSVKLMGVKVFPANDRGSVSEIAAGVNYAIANGAHIINASYGGEANTGFSQTELAAINAARNAGILFVAAAGNDGGNMDIARFYPASHALDNIVTVGASNRRDENSTFSNFGAAVDLYAPGEEILSLYYGNNTGVTYLSGTSMAAPHVSGALALLKAQFPSDNYRQLINRLLRGVDRSDRFIGKSQTGGRLNVHRALTTTTNRPFNDDFADRPRFNTENLAIRASNSGATADSSDPSIAGITPSATLWWEWTAPAGGTVSVNTAGSNYDTLVAVYSGATAGALTLVASNDNDGSDPASRLTFTAQAGTTYQICVDGKSGATGLTLLNVGTIPANDAFAAASALSGESVQVVTTNANCSREAGEPRILNFTGGTSLWYKWTAPRTARFQVSAFSDDFDPLLAVYTGTTLASLSLVSSSDNTGIDGAQTAALCTIEATAGTTYSIAIDSKSVSSVGQFTVSIVDSLWQATTGGAITATPAVASDGTVYVGSIDRSFYAFNADGSLKWSKPTGGLIDSSSAAIADDGTVCVGSNDGVLYAFSASGTQQWTRDFGISGGVVTASSSPAIGSDGTIYIRVSDGYLHALNPADGTDRWKANINATTPTFYGNPVVGPDGTIYQGSDETDKTLYAFNPDGTLKWSQPLNSGVYGAPALDASGNIYLVTLTGSVYSFTPGKVQRWAKTSGGSISSSVALSADGTTMYYAGYDAKLYARNTATGDERWTCPLGSEVRASSPAVDADGVIYIGCYDRKVYAINPDGSLKRTYATGDIIRSGPAIVPSTGSNERARLYFGSSDQKLYAFSLSASPAGGPWPQYRANARRLGRAVSETLGITAQPRSQVAVIGLSLALSVSATGEGPLTYQWKKDGVAITGATSATYSVSNVSLATAGTYTVTISGPQGTLTSDNAVITVEPIRPGRLTNLSVRTTAGTGAQILTVGFSISGSAAKPLLIRGIGPTLRTAFGINDALTQLELKVIRMSDSANVVSNTKWGGSDSMSATFDQVFAFGLPRDSADTAVVTSLPNSQGGYSVQLTGTANATGIALAEIYDLDPLVPSSSISRLVNLSARAQVGTGGGILIAGFAISGNVPRRVLIRGIGPALTNFGVAGALADPVLTIHNSSNQVVASNDDWDGDTSIASAANQVYAFPLSASSFDAALLITLQPGTYTASVSGLEGTTGIGLVEVYEVP